MRTALTLAEDAFRLLTCQPAPLAFDGRPIAGLPDRQLPLDELRRLLLAPNLHPETSDGAWRQLAHHARHWGPAWTVGAVGVALPGLTRLAARLSSNRFATLADDIDSELLAGFLHALRTDDLQAPRVWLRLCWAAWRAGHKARHIDDLAELPADMPVGSRTPHRPYGHPDLILGRAVAANVITRAQADLIAATRLGDVLIEQIAAENGVAGSVIRMRRKRAERTLITAIQRGELSGVVLEATFTGDRDAQARRNGLASLPPRRRRAGVEPKEIRGGVHLFQVQRDKPEYVILSPTPAVVTAGRRGGAAADARRSGSARSSHSYSTYDSSWRSSE